MTETSLSRLLLTVSVFVPLLLVGFLVLTLGRTRRGVLFGVSVPLDFGNSAEAARSIHRYRMATGRLIVGVLVVLTLVRHWSPTAFAVGSAVGALVELAGAWLLWQREARVLRPHAAAVPLERSAALASRSASPALSAIAAAWLPLAVEAVWLHLHWDRIPARWAQHWDASGAVNGWGTRSVMGVYFPFIFGTVIILMFLAIATFLSQAPGPQSALRRRGLPPIGGMAWLMSGIFCFVGLLPLTQHVTPKEIAVFVLLQLPATVAVVVWMIYLNGMGAKSGAAESYDGTPDAMWHGGGLFYYNPADAAVVVAKRFGWGWTLNFARPAAWAYIAGVLLVVCLFILLPVLSQK